MLEFAGSIPGVGDKRGRKESGRQAGREAERERGGTDGWEIPDSESTSKVISYW